MFFTFYSSSSSMTIKSDDSLHCSFNKFSKFNCNRFEKNCYEVCWDWIESRDFNTWSRNNDVLNWNLLKHFIYLITFDTQVSLLSLFVSLYYKYSLKLFAFFCILSILVITIFIDQTFYSRTLYELDSRHDFNIILRIH